MIRMLKYGWLCLLPFFMAMNGFAQKPGNLITTDHLIILLDLHESNPMLQTVLKNAGLEHIDINAVKDKDYSALQKLGWSAQLLPDGILHLEKSIGVAVNLNVTVWPQKPAKGGYPGEVVAGINNFARISVREMENGMTRFFVPGNQGAKRVMLAGNFNSWSTLKGSMTKTDSGWIRDEKLEPGVYEYKFIINGNWTVDNNNNLRIDDGEGNINSVYYRYNFTFRLPGYTDANRVSVAGSFNNWDGNQLVLRQVGKAWEIRMFLHEGVHAYHFLVDGKIVTDPANSLTGKGDDGNVASVINFGQVINFRLGGYEDAKHVYLSGSFNNWAPDGLEMKRVNNTWILPYTLATGNYEYKFVVDGKWIPDPTNQHLVHTKGQVNSFISVNPNHTFKLKGFSDAHTVALSGTFNNWTRDSYTMEYKNNEWSISLRLAPGKYLYKFIIDGKWIIDPGNKQWEQNQYGTGNSVIWVQ